MANFFGAGQRANSANAPSLNARVQSAVQGRPLPIGMGQNRLAGNLIWYGDFSAIPANQNGGKGAGGLSGGKGYSGQYDYSASFIVSLGQTISAIQSIINGNQINFLVTPSAAVLTALAAIGITPVYGNLYGVTTETGTYSQVAWSYLTSAHPSAALAYRGEALACFPNLALKTSPALPNFNFELLWATNTDISAVGPDANPADWVSSFLSDPDWGAGLPSVLIGDLSAYRTWCRATGMLISPVLVSQTAAQSHMADIMKGTIANFVWSSGKLGVVPFGEAAVTGNGYTYTPNVTPIYDLGLSDYLPSQGGSSRDNSPISVSRADPSQVLNQVKVEYLDRNNLYNPVTIYDMDEALVVAAGRLKPSDLRAHHFFCLAGAASISASLQMRREKVLATYQFTLDATYILLDPMDIVTLTESNLGLVKQPVRIIEIIENADNSLSYTAEEYLGTVSAPLYARQSSLGQGRNTNVSAGNVNAPIIFEPTGKQSFDPQIWGAVSGSNPALYGGCEIWVSYDGTNYELGTTLPGTSRTGSLTAILPTIAAAVPPAQTVDNTNTLAVDLTECGGSLNSGSSTDMTGLNTACYVDGEIIAYQTATLGAAYHYSLAPLVRGAYGSPISAHPIGARFARLDGEIFKITYTPDRVGATVYLKFLSFNIYGGGRQNLSDVTAVTYTIQGTNQEQLNLVNMVFGSQAGSVASTIKDVKAKLAQAAAASQDTATSSKQILDTHVQQIATSVATIINEQIVRATADQALVDLTNSINAQVGVNQAAIITEQLVRANADTALASSVSTVAATAATNTAAITTEQTARTSGDATLATSIATETANRGTAETAINASISSESTARISGDSANATSITAAIAQYQGYFASAQMRFDVLATDGATYATLSMKAAVGSGGTFIEAGIRIALTISGGVTSSQMQLLTQNLIITDGTHTSNAVTIDATTGLLRLKKLLFEELQSSDGTSIDIVGTTGSASMTLTG